MSVIQLIEEQNTEIPRAELTKEIVLLLYESKFFEFTIPANNEKPYIIRPKGYVGHIDVGGKIFAIQPKTNITNVFEMLEIFGNIPRHCVVYANTVIIRCGNDKRNNRHYTATAPLMCGCAS